MNIRCLFVDILSTTIYDSAKNHNLRSRQEIWIEKKIIFSGSILFASSVSSINSRRAETLSNIFPHLIVWVHTGNNSTVWIISTLVTWRIWGQKQMQNFSKNDCGGSYFRCPSLPWMCHDHHGHCGCLCSMLSLWSCDALIWGITKV